jgi:RNA recognition motif-containing protein
MSRDSRDSRLYVGGLKPDITEQELEDEVCAVGWFRSFVDYVMDLFVR